MTGLGLLMISSVRTCTLDRVARSTARLGRHLLEHHQHFAKRVDFVPEFKDYGGCLLYTSPSPRDRSLS
eukprot:4533503-Pyramimonas_sp.AAC.1